MARFDGEQAVDGWMVAYYDSLNARAERDSLWQEAQDRWLAILDATLSMVEHELLAPIRLKLATRGLGASEASPSPVVLIPNRALAVLPLAAAWWKEAGRRVHWLDRFVVRVAPSVTVFAGAWRREQDRPPGTRLVGVANPASQGEASLPFTDWECEEIETLLGNANCLFLRGQTATKARFLAEHRSAHRLHLSCHGHYDQHEPERSALLLAGNDRLDLGTILTKCDLPRAWLVTLSACETALTDFRDSTDEGVGLPFGFLYAGAPTVWGTLWSVNDLSTAALMVRAYHELESGRPKAEALRAAQRWLRDLTVRELEAFLQRRITRIADVTSADRRTADAVWRGQRIRFANLPPEERPFAHPYYWAGFQNVGA